MGDDFQRRFRDLLAVTTPAGCAKHDSALRPRLLALPHARQSVNTPATPPIGDERDYLREHLDELGREIALLRAMVARQQERIADRHVQVQSSSRHRRPMSAQ
jgi:hypothetical protein